MRTQIEYTIKDYFFRPWFFQQLLIIFKQKEIRKYSKYKFHI